MGILGRRDRGALDPGAEGAGPGAEDRAPDPTVSDALALAAERTGEIILAIRELLKELDRARGSADRGGGRLKSSLIESLADATRQVYSEAEELSRRVGAARRDLGDAAVARPPSRPAETEAPSAAEPPSPGVQALVTQMAAFGSSRLEIEERLRSEFGIANAAAAVAHVLDGAESERREDD
jgi:hypothetical protein